MAGAATVRVEAGTALYTAAAGELNSVRGGGTRDGVSFDDFGARSSRDLVLRAR